jgi:hypothetical protein
VLVLLLKENSKTPVPMVRELVFLDADNSADLSELGFVFVQGRGVNGRKLDGEVLVRSFGMSFLVLWEGGTKEVIVFPVAFEVNMFAEERGLCV